MAIPAAVKAVFALMALVSKMMTSAKVDVELIQLVVMLVQMLIPLTNAALKELTVCQEPYVALLIGLVKIVKETLHAVQMARCAAVAVVVVVAVGGAAHQGYLLKIRQPLELVAIKTHQQVVV